MRGACLRAGLRIAQCPVPTSERESRAPNRGQAALARTADRTPRRLTSSRIPVVLVELAIEAEAHGWHGLFLWDHIVYGIPSRRWPTRGLRSARSPLARDGYASARAGHAAVPTARTEGRPGDGEPRPPQRRHRLTLGVGLGNQAELAQFGEVESLPERAHRLDEGLSRLSEFWSGRFEPPPGSAAASIPVWVAAVWPHRRPIDRALQWDGLFPSNTGTRSADRTGRRNRALAPRRVDEV